MDSEEWLHFIMTEVTNFVWKIDISLLLHKRNFAIWNHRFIWPIYYALYTNCGNYFLLQVNRSDIYFSVFCTAYLFTLYIYESVCAITTISYHWVGSTICNKDTYNNTNKIQIYAWQGICSHKIVVSNLIEYAMTWCIKIYEEYSGVLKIHW